jgi:hypothetical protein
MCGSALAFALRRPKVQLAVDGKRFPEPILNDSIPDPVFDGKSPYKGRVPYGLSTFAEKINGRFAMMGFTILFLQELVFGRGVLDLYGLPYDPGAIINSR